ncbi:MAG: response regulator [Pirellulaceae bacterium]
MDRLSAQPMEKSVSQHENRRGADLGVSHQAQQNISFPRVDFPVLDSVLPEKNAPRALVDGISGKLLEQLSEAAMSFSLQLDYKTLVLEIANRAANILIAERVIVYSHLDNRLRREAWLPTWDMDWPTIESLPDEALQAIRHLEPILTKPQEANERKVRNSIFVPFVGTQNRALGLIELQNKKRGAFFNSQDLRLAMFLARIATSAVDRSRQFDRIEEWSQSIEMLLSFNATVNQHLKPQEMVRQLVVNATGFIDADGGAAGIAIYNEVEPMMECEGFYFDEAWHPYTRRWKANAGIPGTVLETEFPLLMNDYQSNPLADFDLAQNFDIGSCICVAIKNASEKVLGFFKLHRRVGQPEFTWQDAAVLESLGNTAAVAIENARLVKSLELKNEQVKNLSAAHVRRLEEERQHIARELHDETGQVLIGLKLRLQLLSQNLMPCQVGAKQELNSLREQVNEATVRLKDLAKRLRPPTLDELGFEATLRQLLAEYRRQVAFDIQLTAGNGERHLTKEAETALYRIVQESLTNIIKHARATVVTIELFERDGFPALSISDNGCGFYLESATTGLGLVGIRERVKMLGALVDIQSAIGNGTVIEVYRIPMNEKRRVILADDHNLVRSGLAALLGQDGHYEVVAEAINGIDALEKVEAHDADLLIVDLAMPRLGGIEVIQGIRSRQLPLKVLVLSMYDDAQFVARAIKAGANGYLLKHALEEELFRAIDRVMSGETFISELIDQDALREFSFEDNDLTPREIEVLHLIAEGLTNSQVAVTLNISPNTATRHRANLMQKLNVHNRVELIHAANNRGLITISKAQG